MENFRRIIENNRAWATSMTEHDPEYFEKRANKQEPHFLYIGCADSRVPSNAVTGTQPGELFVHRNIANLVIPSDLNAMSVLQYAVEVLDVKHVIVTGHYGCGGVRAAMSGQHFGLVDHWLGPVRNVVRWNREELDAIADPQARFDRVVELNVMEQIYHLTETPVIQQAWAKGRRPLLHGLVYDIHTGLLREVATGIDGQDAADALAARRLSGVPAGPPPIAGRLQTAPTLTGKALADAIAARVVEQLAAPAWGGSAPR
jgi:carbonic anhydrase